MKVFITGLFTKVQETTKNIPIVRTGTVAMIPGEKSFLATNSLMHTSLKPAQLEVRAVHQCLCENTQKMQVFTASGRITDSGNNPLPQNTIVEMQDLEGSISLAP